MVNLEKFLFSLLGTRNFPAKTDSDTLLKLWKKFQNSNSTQTQSVGELVDEILQDRVSKRYDAETMKIRTKHFVKPYMLQLDPLPFPDLDYDTEEHKYWNSTDILVGGHVEYTIPDYMQDITSVPYEPLSDDKNIMSSSTTAEPKGRIAKIKTSDWF